MILAAEAEGDGDGEEEEEVMDVLYQEQLSSSLNSLEVNAFIFPPVYYPSKVYGFSFMWHFYLLLQVIIPVHDSLIV